MPDNKNQNFSTDLNQQSFLFGFSPAGKELSHHLTDTLNRQNASDRIKEKRKKEIYKNVLSYPQDTDYLKYFEKNPHP